MSDPKDRFRRTDRVTVNGRPALGYGASASEPTFWVCSGCHSTLTDGRCRNAACWAREDIDALLDRIGGDQ